MTVTFTGVAASFVAIGNDNNIQNLFTAENGIHSRVDLYIRRLALQNDSIAVLASVMPICKTSRAINIGGGVFIPKETFDNSQTSDPNVVFRCQVDESAYITAISGPTAWGQFPNRLHTAVEQQQGTEQNMLPMLVGNVGSEFILHPGENLLVQQIAPNGASNFMGTPNFFIECVFQEVALSTFNISGTVTLSASPITGAKVTVLECDDINMTNPFLVGVYTTPAGGTWSASIRTGKIGFAYVQYQSGGNYYTSPGSPFLS
jgi:hypothetical protein